MSTQKRDTTHEACARLDVSGTVLAPLTGLLEACLVDSVDWLGSAPWDRRSEEMCVGRLSLVVLCFLLVILLGEVMEWARRLGLVRS